MLKLMKEIYHEGKKPEATLRDVVEMGVFGGLVLLAGATFLSVGTPLMLLGGGAAFLAGIFLTATAASGAAGYTAKRIQARLQPFEISAGEAEKYGVPSAVLAREAADDFNKNASPVPDVAPTVKQPQPVLRNKL